MSKPRRKSPPPLTGEWPAPTTTSEKVQIFALLAVLGVAAGIAYMPSSQRLTPISLSWLLAPTAIGTAIGFQLARLLARVNRYYNPPSVNFMAGAIVTFLAGFLFHAMAWAIVDNREFRGSGAAFTGTYRILNCTVDKRDSHHWLLINPYGLPRAAMVPISRRQYSRIMATVPDCRIANLCVRVPSERASNGAIRIMTTDESGPPDFRPVQQCSDVLVLKAR
jgi:hypothetical protein